MCDTCHGGGWVRAPGKKTPPPPPELREFLQAWAGIERDGMEGWLERERAAGERRPLDDGFVGWLDVLRAKLDELEFEQDIDDAIRDAKSRK